MKFLVAGYYGESNLGDEAFRCAIPKIIGTNHEYEFVTVGEYAKLPKERLNNFDRVLLGGGDVVLPYFLDKLRENHFENGPVVLFGAGLTYPSCVALGHVDQFDSVFLRNTTDLRIVERRIGVKHTHFVPDLAFVLEPEMPRAAHCAERRPQAAFFPIASLFQKQPDSVARQEHVLYQLAQSIAHASKTHDVTLIRFDTSGKRGNDDKFVCERLMTLCAAQACDGSLRFDETVYDTPQKMLSRMADFDVAVCMRFHSHVFAIIQQIPFVSLTLTRKVEMLMKETHLYETASVHLIKDPISLRPLDLPVEQFCQRFDHAVANAASVKTTLQRVYVERHQLLTSGVYARLLSAAKCRKMGMQIVKQDSRSVMVTSHVEEQRVREIDAVTERMAKSWQRKFQQNPLSGSRSATEAPASKMTARDRERRANRICERAIFEITGETKSRFLWGFSNNMLTNPFKIRDYISWIWDTFHGAPPDEKKPTVFRNALYFDYMQQQEGRNAHRSGWPFVVQNLRSLSSKYGVFCDTYVDRTFHWSYNVLRKAAVVPYTHSWIGFVHHTPLVDYSDYNVVCMLENPDFRSSLLTCRGLFVLSKTLKDWFDCEFAKLGIRVPVRALCHPTLIPKINECFSMQRFLCNRKRKLVNIGAWLRDTFAIFEIGILDNANRALRYNARGTRSEKKSGVSWPMSVGQLVDGRRKRRLERCVLRGSDMSLYMPPDRLCIDNCATICVDHDVDSSSSSSGDDSSNCSTESDSDVVGICRHRCGKQCDKNCPLKDRHDGQRCPACSRGSETHCDNKWVLGLRQYVGDTVLESARVLDRLSNKDYDNLLVENIVFLRLYDASACNTLLECVVRNTPLLINRLPAVVEVLGEDYPFYYSSLADALIKSRDVCLIRRTHRYLQRLDKVRFHVETFINELQTSDVYQEIVTQTAE